MGETSAMPSFHLTAEQRHLAWDNALPPEVTVEPGDEVTLELIDSSGGQITEHDDATALARLEFSAVNPCTGPVAVAGAVPGDDLVVTIIDIDTGGWGWVANIPGFGLLADDFPDPHLRIARRTGDTVELIPGVDIPARPMIGTIGVAPAAPGPAPLLVPTDAGGNMDIPQIGAGSTLHLPVQVQGALLSAGDTHIVQGDGEVCGTGVETRSTLRVRVDVRRGAGTATPWYEHPTSTSAIAAMVATTGIGPDLFAAAKDATRRAVDLVSAGSGIDPIDAYLALSLTGSLRISEIVDAPNWVVSMGFPARLRG
jgi:acetamidase/formamidase